MTRKIVFLFLLLWLCSLRQPCFSQNPRRDVDILDFIDTTIRNYYYDPAYHGIDLDAHFKSIREKLKKSKSDAVLGCLFNRELKAYEVKDRKNRERFTVKPHKKGAYEGELVTLVDSNSASGAELIARVVQLEKRGKVIGDRTAG